MIFKPEIHGPKPVGSRLRGSDWDEPGPKNREILNRTDKIFENLGQIRTGRFPDLTIRGSLKNPQGFDLKFYPEMTLNLTVVCQSEIQRGKYILEIIFLTFV